MKRSNSLFIFCSLMLLTLLFSACGGRPAGAAKPPAPTVTRPAQVPTAPLRATLEVPATLDNGEAVPLTFTLVNNMDRDIYALTWHTPFEGIINKIFRITRDGEILPYEGIMVMRGDPSQDDYIFLNAHTSQSVEVDLASAYDISQAGVYTIEYIAPLMHIAGSEAEMAQTQTDLKQIVIPCNRVTITIASSIP